MTQSEAVKLVRWSYEDGRKSNVYDLDQYRSNVKKIVDYKPTPIKSNKPSTKKLKNDRERQRDKNRR